MARVLVLADHYAPGYRAGGPIRSVARIVEDESRSHDVWVVTRDHDLGSPERYEIATATWVPTHGAQVLYVDLGSLRGMASALRHIRRVRPDLVYVNSLWSPFFALLPIVACRTVAPRLPVLLAPRGSCGPEALAIKARKKALVGPPLRHWLRWSRLIWHTTSAEETSDVAQWLGRPPRRIVTRSDPGTPPASVASPPPADGPLRVVGVSRIAPVKDVARFLRILGGLVNEVDARYYGPVEDTKYMESCRQLMSGLPSNVRFSFEGEVGPDDVAAVFKRADVFLFPTKGENFGHVIAESLAEGCPVMTTPATVWTHLLRRGAGYVFNEDAEAVAWLERLAGETRLERQAGRTRAHRLYRDWRKASLADSSLFSAALHSAARPAKCHC